jgi:methionyl aminopeptidase
MFSFFLIALLVLACGAACNAFTFSFARNKPQLSLKRRQTSLLGSTGFDASPKFHYTGSLRPGPLSPPRTVPNHILKPYYAVSKVNRIPAPHIYPALKPTPEGDIEKMRFAGKYARQVLDAAMEFCYSSKPGTFTTDQIDAVVHQESIARNCYPSPLNYHGFPKSCCTSINEVMVHGIPDTTSYLQEGDVLNIDVTLFYEGVHGDCSETIYIGNPSKMKPEIKDLLKTTYTAWMKAIRFCQPGRFVNEIGGIIEDVVEPKGYISCPELAGHG